jgi:hypothetical protein
VAATQGTLALGLGTIADQIGGLRVKNPCGSLRVGSETLACHMLAITKQELSLNHEQRIDRVHYGNNPNIYIEK